MRIFTHALASAIFLSLIADASATPIPGSTAAPARVVASVATSKAAAASVAVQVGEAGEAAIAHEDVDAEYWHLGRARLKITDSLLVVVTLMLFGATWALFLATRRLVVGADRNAEAQMRSYLFVEVWLEQNLVFSHTGNAGSPIKIRVTNHGSTPALLTKIRAYPQVSEDAPIELIAHPRSELELPEGIAVGANRTYEIEVLAHVTYAEQTEMESGTKTLFCCGRFEYEDVLGKRRETGFCWHVQGGRRDRFSITPKTPLNRRT